MAVALNKGELCFTGIDGVLPTEFPYEEHSLAELTHLLTRSPLHHNPPKFNSVGTNFKSTWEFCGSPAAGHVAKQMNTWHHRAPAKGFGRSDLFLSHHSFSPPNHYFELERQWSVICERPNREAFLFHQSRGNRPVDLGALEILSGRRVSPPSLGVTQSSRQPRSQSHHRNLVSVQRGGDGFGVRGFVSGEKKECAGTGVFIPRRYGNPSSDSSKKQGSTALLQAKRPVNDPFILENDLLGARQNVSIAQQSKYSPNLRPIAAMKHLESCLPQDWTY